MYALCHRCGGDLPSHSESTVFCPHCGAPQLVLSESCLPAEGADPGAITDTTGVPQPPHPRQVDWRAAIRCAGLVAALAGVFSLASMRIQILSPLSTLWTLSGSMITLALYQRRRPLAWMDAAIGARIGTLVGLSLIACLGIALATGGMVARFGLHTMATFDTDLAQRMHTEIQRAAQASAQSNAQNGTPSAAPPEMIAFFNSPEFRAGMMLLGLGMLASFLLAFSTLGGALGGLLRKRRSAIS